METLAAIRTRRTVRAFRAALPPRTLIEQVLEAAIWAPNYHLSQPWRFFVFAGEARVTGLARAIGDARRESLRGKGVDPDSPAGRARIASDQAIALDAPVVVAVGCVPQLDRPLVKEIEEIQAVAAAVQNMQLAAHALGLGAMWQTCGLNEKPLVKRFLGLQESDSIVGFIKLGYPEGPLPSPGARADWRAKSRWYWPEEL